MESEVKKNSQPKKSNMSGRRSTGTKPEETLRKALRAAGIKGFSENDARVAGKPDICFLARKLAIFVDGCFWHSCPLCARSAPKSSESFWRGKFERNAIRDEKINRGLSSSGWMVLRVWEHGLRTKEGVADAVRCVEAAMRMTDIRRSGK